MPATAAQRKRLEASYAVWTATLYPKHVNQPFGVHQQRFWRWAWALRRGKYARPFVAAWARGHAKSTGAELAATSWGARGVRRYGLYIHGVQEKANDHVENIAALLLAPLFGVFYPEHSGPGSVSTYGPKAWRRNRLRTRGGFVVDALGMDTAVRGVKIEEQRPDFIVFDDVDDSSDSAKITERKVRAMTRAILPARGPDCAVLVIQNVPNREGIMSALLGKSETWEADFLQDRIVSGPVPAVQGLTLARRKGKDVIIGGSATWEGMPIRKCQELLASEGRTAFMAEHQLEPLDVEGGLYTDDLFRRVQPGNHPDIVRKVCWVDPAVTRTDKSDSAGIIVDGLGEDGVIYREWAWEKRATPEEALELAIEKAYEHRCYKVGVETDQGRDTWRAVFRAAHRAVLARRGDIVQAIRYKRMRRLKFDEAHASVSQESKVARSARMLADYERGKVRHVIDPHGAHVVLERALKRFPLVPPLDLADAAYWSWDDLRGVGLGRPKKYKDDRLAGRR